MVLTADDLTMIETSRMLFASKIRSERPGKRCLNGGGLIAIVGGDGAGKSTAVEELHGWLSQRFDARRIHLGKPPSSLSTVAVAGLAKAFRIAAGLFKSKERSSETPRANLLDLLSHLCTARDRYRLYLKARRFSSNGGLVICDRYPLPEIQLMDGPKIAAETEGRDGRVIRLLKRIEERLYKLILPPDTLIVLRVHPEIAARRKTTEPASHVCSRSQEIWQARWDKSRAIVVDASQPLEEVLAELKTIVWSRL